MDMKQKVFMDVQRNGIEYEIDYYLDLYLLAGNKKWFIPLHYVSYLLTYKN